jgi:hypothetical protein
MLMMEKLVETVIQHVHMVVKITNLVQCAILHAELVMVKAQMNVSLVGAMPIVFSQINPQVVVSVTTIAREQLMPVHQNVLMAVLHVVHQTVRIVNFVLQIMYFSTLLHLPVLHVLTR